MKYFSVLHAAWFALLTLNGCANLGHPQRAATIKLIPVENDTLLKHANIPKSLYLQIGIIVGGLYGPPSMKPRQLIEISKKLPASLDIGVLEGVYGPLSTPITKEAAKGLIISPEGTQVLRLATFGSEPIEGKLLPGGLRNKAGNAIMLVYFDRPCTIEGSVQFGPEVTAHHAIKIDKAGVYKIISAKTETGFEVTVENNNDPIRVELGDSLFTK